MIRSYNRILVELGLQRQMNAAVPDIAYFECVILRECMLYPEGPVNRIWHRFIGNEARGAGSCVGHRQSACALARQNSSRLQKACGTLPAFVGRTWFVDGLAQLRRGRQNSQVVEEN